MMGYLLFCREGLSLVGERIFFFKFCLCFFGVFTGFFMLVGFLSGFVRFVG